MSNKVDFKDVTFLIPIRIDSIMRLENLLMVTDFINSYLDTNILVLEASNYNNGLIDKLIGSSVQVLWREDFDPVFHRTFYINEMVKKCETKYVGVWDADVIIPVEQIDHALKELRNGSVDFVIPFDQFLDTSYIIRERYLKLRDIEILRKNEKKMLSLYENPKPVGGAFIVNRKIYSEAGMENEKFYGWGIEDGERINRLITLGTNYKHIQGKLYHLTHERGSNSQIQSQVERNQKSREFSRNRSMSAEQLLREIKSWKIK